MDAAVDVRPERPWYGATMGIVRPRAAVLGWGTFQMEWRTAARIPVPAGRLTVVVWVPWTFPFSVAHAVLDLAPGQVVGLGWRERGIGWMGGTMAIADVGPPAGLALPIAAAPPGSPGPCRVEALHGAWHPDPSGRWAQRWWDGRRWTDAVSDGTSTDLDP